MFQFKYECFTDKEVAEEQVVKSKSICVGDPLGKNSNAGSFWLAWIKEPRSALMVCISYTASSQNAADLLYFCSS